jgi:endonuclease/exonuclease/phosphatase family metal-dependent hydrolase
MGVNDLQLTIFSFNIHSGRDLFFRKSFSLIADFLSTQPADIIGFQEVQNNSKHGWQFEALKEALKMNGIFGENLSVAKGGYGNALFSHFPILKWENIQLPSRREQRGILTSLLEVHGIVVHALNTHLSLHKETRQAQHSFIASLIQKTDQPCLLMGDFNSFFPPVYPGLTDLGLAAGKKTIPTVTPMKKRIDYLFTSSSFRLVEYDVLPLPFSDHFPIKAIVEI